MAFVVSYYLHSPLHIHFFGHFVVLLMLVNILDCCDGSDEYDGAVKCPNTCWEAGKVARDKLKKKIATYKDGVALRKKDVEQAKVAFAKDEAELSKLKNEEKILKDVVQQLKGMCFVSCCCSTHFCLML